MPTRATPATTPPARTHHQAIELFRRPFAPGAIGFRAMTKVAYNGDPWGGAQVAAYLNAQSVIQRLNCVVPGRWRQEFGPLEGDPHARKARRNRLTDHPRQPPRGPQTAFTGPGIPGGPALERLKATIAAATSPYGLGLRDDGRSPTDPRRQGWDTFQPAQVVHFSTGLDT